MIDAKDLIKVIAAAGYEPEPYSGRKMYGASCVAFRCGNNNTFRIGIELCGAINETEDCSIDFGDLYEVTFEWDNLGHDYIYYFPTVKWKNDEDKDEE